MFARRMRAYRKLKHLTQQELAAVLGVSVAVVGGMERGTRLPTDAIIEKLLTALCVSRMELGLEELAPCMQGDGGEKRWRQ
ncbi:MAG: helix-turn-helix domain-containing protein [Bacilli bacterium]